MEVKLCYGKDEWLAGDVNFSFLHIIEVEYLKQALKTDNIEIKFKFDIFVICHFKVIALVSCFCNKSDVFISFQALTQVLSVRLTLNFKTSF